MFVSERRFYVLLAASSTFLLVISLLRALAQSDGSKLHPPNTETPISRKSKGTSRNDNGTGVGAKQRVSDALLIGVSKCGSKALMFFLDLQPQVFPILGEVEYLCDGVNFKKGVDFYYENLPKDVPDDQLIFEKDGTCWRRDQYPQRVYETYKSLNKTLKIVAVVCDPVYRAQSWYIHGTNNEKIGMKNGRYDTDFEGVAFNPDGSVNTQFDGIVAATYDERFAPWLKYFDRKQIQIIDGDLMKKDPYQVIHDLETFLGLEHRVTREHFYFNETKGYFCKVRHPPDGSIRCMIPSKGRYHPKIDMKLIQKLYEHFKPHNNRFEELTGQNFLWNMY